jgi:hypothetical protein
MKRFLLISASLAAMTWPVAADAASPVTALRSAAVKASGSSKALSGRASFATPDGWSLTSRTRSTASFAADEGGGCTAQVRAGVAAWPTSASLAEQLKRFRHPSDQVLDHGRTRHGAWRVLASGPEPPGTAAPPDLSGLLIERLASRRWLHMNITARFSGCDTSSIRRGAVTTAIARVLQNTKVIVRLDANA